MSELKVDVKVETPGIDNLDRLNGELERTEQTAGRAGDVSQGVFQGIGQAAAGAGLALIDAGISAVVDGIANSIELASDKAEAASKVNVLFGESADKIAEASEHAAENVGLSSGKYLEAAGTIGNLITNLGFAGDEAADMSVDMLQLAADVGSFNNADPTEVVEAMGAAFRGESEPIRRFGVMLDEASIKAKAAELGLVGLDGQVSKNAKAQATYALILEQTSEAQGDFARTSDGLANAQRIANAKVEEAWTKVGDVLAPLAAELVPMLADGLVAVVGFVEDLVKMLAPLADLLEIVGAFVDVLADGLGTVGDAFHDVTAAIDPNIAALDRSRAYFEDLGREAGLTGEQIELAWNTAIERSRAGEQVTAETAASIIARQAEIGDEVQQTAATFEYSKLAIEDSARGAAAAVDNMARASLLASETAERGAHDTQTRVNAAVEAAIEGGRQNIADDYRETMRFAGQAAEAQGLADAHDLGAAIPGEIGDGIYQEANSLSPALDHIRDVLEHGLTPEEMAMQAIGEKAIKTIRSGLNSEIPGLKETSQQAAIAAIETIETAGLTGAKGQRGLKAIGIYYDELLASGLTAAEARAALAAGGVADATIDGLEGNVSSAGDVADAYVSKFTRALLNSKPEVKAAINTVFGSTMRGQSPPPEGPLSDIDKWPGPIVDTYIEAWARAMERGDLGAFAPLADNLGPDVVRDVELGGRPGRRGRGQAPPVQIIVNAGVGDPVEIGRAVVEAIGAYERASGRDWRAD